MASSPSVILTMVGDPELAASADRIAAAVGACPIPAESPSRRAWVAAAAVVVDEDGARRCMRSALPRRDGVVLITSDAPTPADWSAAVGVGAELLCALPLQEAELVRRLAEAAEGERAAGRRGPVIAVAAGRGGAGASVFSAALATCAADSLLVDLDPCGAGIDLLVGAESVSGLRWPDLDTHGGRLAWSAVRDAIPRRAGMSILSNGRRFHEIDPGAIDAILDAARRGGPTVVCDVPRQITSAGASAVQAADLVVVVMTCDVRGIASAAAVMDPLRTLNPAVGVVVRGPSPGGLAARDAADAVAAPLLASMRPEPMLAQRLEHGRLRLRRRSPLTAAARAVLGTLPGTRAVRAA